MSENSCAMDISFGVTNAQCRCFDCMNNPPQHMEATSEENSGYTSQCSVYDEDTVDDTAFSDNCCLLIAPVKVFCKSHACFSE